MSAAFCANKKNIYNLIRFIESIRGSIIHTEMILINQFNYLQPSSTIMLYLHYNYTGKILDS